MPPPAINIMSSDIAPCSVEREFCLNALREGRRLDMRQMLEYRPLDIRMGPDWGQVEVSLGTTRLDFAHSYHHITLVWNSIAVHSTCTLARPYPERPTEGKLFIFAEFSPMGFPGLETTRLFPSPYLYSFTNKGWEENRPSEEEILLSRFLS